MVEHVHARNLPQTIMKHRSHRSVLDFGAKPQKSENKRKDFSPSHNIGGLVDLSFFSLPRSGEGGLRKHQAQQKELVKPFLRLAMHKDQESDMEERGMESGANMMSSCSRPLLDRRLKPQAEQDLKCPRCDSTNTKFCYYNNYSLTQPRHFCKTCRRYWTKGGTLRSVPVGGGCRKNSKRSNSGSNNNSNNNSKRSGDQPCSTSTDGTGTATDLSPSIGGASSNNYGYYNEAEELGMNNYGNSAYVADMAAAAS
ncbi:hypothetical protein SUGI_0851480 [Cryptomeria japonica]|nr:hypothetical protein SUGI_0851480 [Cryptomeria japonica]